MLNRAQSLQLLTVLRNHFPAVLSVMPVAPFLVIECNKVVPGTARTPFLIAGLIACFVVQGDPYPFGIDFIGRTAVHWDLRRIKCLIVFGKT